jgi:glycosyltransferase involved in cell wall biosynthesis
LAGLISDVAVLTRHYQQADLVLITSSREGFPLSVMEGMAHGCVPVCTAVGGIPEHIRHQENGWLLPAEDDDAVVEALLQAVKVLAADRSLLQRLSTAARLYAQEQFGGERFCEEYRRVILG